MEYTYEGRSTIMDTFLASYIETAFWSSTDENGTPLDSSESIDCELTDEARAQMQTDCEAFEKQSDILFETYRNLPGNSTARNYSERRELVAHDFWLTRNGHGAGFWDRDYPEPLATQLTDLAHSFGECYLYLGDDGKLHLD
jgi:hypothetical protein